MIRTDGATVAARLVTATMIIEIHRARYGSR
jgi:hypothetical protein